MQKELRAHQYYEKPCEARRRKLSGKKRAIAKARADNRAEIFMRKFNQVRG